MAAARLGVSKYLVVPLSLALLALAMSAPLVAAGNGGNSTSAHLCQKGGWMDYTTSDGTPFANQDDCVSYAANGGTLTPLPAHLTLSPGTLVSCTTTDACDWAYSATGDFTQTYTITNTGGPMTQPFGPSSGSSDWGADVLTSDTCRYRTLAAGDTCSFVISVADSPCSYTGYHQLFYSIDDGGGDAVDLTVTESVDVCPIII